MEQNTLLLLCLIFILGVSIFFVCSSKSTFGGGNSEKTSVIPKVTDSSVLIFYAPWCGHCKSSMDEFKKAVAQGQGDIVLIDSTDESNASILSKYNVQGFPTIIKGDGTKYSGSRTAESIVTFKDS
jgi:protein disulfide-isomerase A6